MTASALPLREALRFLPHDPSLYRIAEVVRSDPTSIVCHTTAELPSWMHRSSGEGSAMQLIESVAQAAAIGRILATPAGSAAVAKKGAVLRVKQFRFSSTQAMPARLEITAHWGSEFNGAFEVHTEIRLPETKELVATGQLTMREFV